MIPLPAGPFDVILADPPWAFETHSAKGQGKSASQHYDTMTAGAIAALPVASLAADDAVLVMWSTWSQVAISAPQAVMRVWGFRPVTGGAWLKTTAEALPSFGTGYILRDACEPFLIGRRGRMLAGWSRSERNAIIAQRREHSRKPDEMHEMIERLAPNARRLELFARAPRPGWTVWGNETTKFAGAA